MLEAEGLANVFKRHDRLARATRAGVEALGLELFAKATPSPALTAVVAPPGRRQRDDRSPPTPTSHNITIAGGQGEMKGKVFRLGHMGYVGEFDVIDGARRPRAGARRARRSPWTSAPACARPRRSSPSAG